MKRICNEQGCEARAWHGEFCNLHALDRFRGTPGQPRRRTPSERLAEGRRLLRQRAKELGIAVADSTAGQPAQKAPARDSQRVVVAARAGKVRSPVA